MNQEIVTITLFRFKGFKNKFWAFSQMQLAHTQLTNTPGLQFYKLMGSGSEEGFSIYPNFGVYSFMGVWENETFAKDFFDHHPTYQQYNQHSVEKWTVFMQTTMAHGNWSAIQPFQKTTKFDKNKIVAVLTRASIRTKRLIEFWKSVPAVGQMMKDQNGRLFSIGIGELPIVQQATFSLWQNSHQMEQFAYQAKHLEIIKRTRARAWYTEELFARFLPYACEGTWKGSCLLADYKL